MINIGNCANCGKTVIDNERCNCRNRKLIGYSNKECINCSRLRVEIFDSGDCICEKCKVNQDTGEYDFGEVE